MLKNLEIKNYALIQNLSIDLDKGLNIITGETGAGKSILLGALGLIMGKRADSKVLFDPTNKCVVEAKFDLSGIQLKPFFVEHELDYEDDLVIRREISAAGKSRAFINDTPTTLDVLQMLADNLVDLHQQFDTLAMHKQKFQLEAIDALAGVQTDLSNFRKDFVVYKAKEKTLEELRNIALNANKELDYINFQWKEINEAKLQENEQTELEASLVKLTNAEDISRIASMASNIIEENEQSIVGTLTNLAREFSTIAKIDDEYKSVYERILGSIEELKDIAGEAANIADDTESDPAQANIVQERLNLIYKLQKKHGFTNSTELIELGKNLQAQLKSFENNDDNILAIEKELAELKIKLSKQAQALSVKRQKIVPAFEKQINDLLVQLSMPNARLKVEIKQEVDFNPSGIDNVQFLFATNKGSEFLPLKDVASGGEMSRLTLCIKSVLAEKMKLATMIFDEIDTGVSGEVASKMGNILRAMAKGHQLIVITHSPQIASKADIHYYVYKKDEKDRTISHMRILTKEERLQEIAKMLSGENPGKAALDNAKELLQSK
jgi:DNA repair protein RecN (Recombination protein N)